MSCTALVKAVKPVWAEILARLPYLVLKDRFPFVSHTTLNGSFVKGVFFPKKYQVKEKCDVTITFICL